MPRRTSRPSSRWKTPPTSNLSGPAIASTRASLTRSSASPRKSIAFRMRLWRMASLLFSIMRSLSPFFRSVASTTFPRTYRSSRSSRRAILTSTQRFDPSFLVTPNSWTMGLWDRPRPGVAGLLGLFVFTLEARGLRQAPEGLSDQLLLIAAEDLGELGVGHLEGAVLEDVYPHRRVFQDVPAHRL